MTSTGLGRHNSKPLLDWDDVDMNDETQEGGRHEASEVMQRQTGAAPESRAEIQAQGEGKDRGASPWSAMRKLFKR